MSHLLDDDDDVAPGAERELTLGTGAILGIFFGLALLCGLFFAFGYNVAARRTVAVAAALPPATTVTTAPAPSFDTFKPSAGSSATVRPSPAHQASEDTSDVPPARAPQPQPSPRSTPPAPIVRVAPPPAAEPSPTTATSAAAGAPGVFLVQVAAVSHQGDADLLLSALRAHGYSVVGRPGTQDKLIHIQVGPFANKADAEAMRQRLLGDGYNAILK